MVRRKTRLAVATLGLLSLILAIGVIVVPQGLFASSHREAPITALDRAADITDVYAFRSYDEDGESEGDVDNPSITMIMNVDPLPRACQRPDLVPV